MTKYAQSLIYVTLTFPNLAVDNTSLNLIKNEIFLNPNTNQMYDKTTGL